MLILVVGLFHVDCPVLMKKKTSSQAAATFQKLSQNKNGGDDDDDDCVWNEVCYNFLNEQSVGTQKKIGILCKKLS